MTDLDLMRSMTDQQRFLFQTEMLKQRKSVGTAARAAVVALARPGGAPREGKP